MAALAMAHGAVLPQRAEGAGLGAVLSLLAHALLVAALAWGVSWRAVPEQTFSAELWAAVPQQAAAPLQPPPPPAEGVRRPLPPAPMALAAVPQPDAQIAIDKAARDKQRRDTRARDLREAKEREAQEHALAENKRQELLALEQKAEDERLARQRDANLRRMLGQAGATGAPQATGNALRDAAPSAAYAGRIKGRIKPLIVFTENLSTNPETEVEVRCAPDGTIVGRRVVKSSGVKSWDEAVLRAVDRAEVLPRDTDGRVPATLTLVFRLHD